MVDDLLGSVPDVCIPVLELLPSFGCGLSSVASGCVTAQHLLTGIQKSLGAPICACLLGLFCLTFLMNKGRL